jgi:DNA repair exonuclease SbcCD nuclease subunit
MKFLATADLHLTGRKADAYRWSIFPWLRTQGASRKVDAFFILGDVTDSKDNHGSVLVNRLVSELLGLAAVAPVYAISGNHDYTDPEWPFFRFLSELHERGVHFYTKRTALTLNGERFLLLPHVRNPEDAWQRKDMRNQDFIMVHQPVMGAVQENGQRRRDGMSMLLFSKANKDCTILGGDIHVPQEVTQRDAPGGRSRGVYHKLTYCGAPHPVRFGDDYKPRVLFYDGRRLQSVPRVTLRKHIARVSDPAQLAEQGLTPGDMVRVELRIPRAEFVHGRELQRRVREQCKALGLVLCGSEIREKPTKRVRVGQDAPVQGAETPTDTLARYAKAHGLGRAFLKLGRKLLSEAAA